MISHAHPDLYGLCRSPHDYPQKWALMMTMYLDESMQAGNGYVVVAGFVGNDESWNECMRQWRPGLGQRPALHMKGLRGWDKERNRELLYDLGRIPRECGLTLVYSSVKVSDYHDLVEGTIASLFAEGYHVALFMLLSRAMLALPVDERVEVICEQQIEHAAIRESIFRTASRYPEWKTTSGLSRIAKWSSISKSMVMEPSDYAAYSIMQRLIDPTSRKAEMCAPILMNPRRIGKCMGKHEARLGIANSIAGFKGPNILMDSDMKVLLRAAFKEKYGGKDDGTRSVRCSDEKDFERV